MAGRDGGHRVQRRGCRDGNHSYGWETSVGAGLKRNRCKYCGAVTIDLRHANDNALSSPGGSGSNSLPDPPPQVGGLFGRRGRISIFDIEQAVTAGLLQPREDRR